MESVGLLASGVAHDFNNKLGVIMGNAEIALELLDESHPAYSRLKEIVKASSLSADLTRQLLTFARKQEIYPRVLDLNQALGNIFKMLDRLIGEDIKLVYEAGENLWPVKIDPAQLDQIMANLCVNARDAMPNGGTLTIETEGVRFDDGAQTAQEAPPGEYIRVSVSDTGVGMSPEVCARAIEPFFTTKDVGKGTGLGLSTARQIVNERMGGSLTLLPTQNGTAFRVRFPFKQT